MASSSIQTQSDDPQLAGADRQDAIQLLGVRIDRLRLPDLLEQAAAAAKRRTRTTILYVNVHCMNVCHRDRTHADILQRAEIVYCDGTGVRLGAWLAGQNIPERMTGADWIDDLCALAVRNGLSLYFLGGSRRAAGEAAKVLEDRHLGLRIAGTAGGYNVGAHEVAEINRLRPDILLVGMGTPTQEKWIDAQRAELEAPVVWAVGALFDFASGRIPRGPRWMTEHGMEWVCRLAAEPRKLWRRYLIGNPYFFYRVMRERLR